MAPNAKPTGIQEVVPAGEPSSSSPSSPPSTSIAGDGTDSPPNRFPQFLALPQELQDQVWAEAAGGLPSVHFLEWYSIDGIFYSGIGLRTRIWEDVDYLIRGIRAIDNGDEIPSLPPRERWQASTPSYPKPVRYKLTVPQLNREHYLKASGYYANGAGLEQVCASSRQSLVGRRRRQEIARSKLAREADALAAASVASRDQDQRSADENDFNPPPSNGGPDPDEKATAAPKAAANKTESWFSISTSLAPEKGKNPAISFPVDRDNDLVCLLRPLVKAYGASCGRLTDDFMATHYPEMTRVKNLAFLWQEEINSCRECVGCRTLLEHYKAMKGLNKQVADRVSTYVGAPAEGHLANRTLCNDGEATAGGIRHTRSRLDDRRTERWNEVLANPENLGFADRYDLYRVFVDRNLVKEYIKSIVDGHSPEGGETSVSLKYLEDEYEIYNHSPGISFNEMRGIWSVFEGLPASNLLPPDPPEIRPRFFRHNPEGGAYPVVPVHGSHWLCGHYNFNWYDDIAVAQPQLCPELENFCLIDLDLKLKPGFKIPTGAKQWMDGVGGVLVEVDPFDDRWQSETKPGKPTAADFIKWATKTWSDWNESNPQSRMPRNCTAKGKVLAYVSESGPGSPRDWTANDHLRYSPIISNLLAQDKERLG